MRKSSRVTKKPELFSPSKGLSTVNEESSSSSEDENSDNEDFVGKKVTKTNTVKNNESTNKKPPTRTKKDVLNTSQINDNNLFCNYYCFLIK